MVRHLKQIISGGVKELTRRDRLKNDIKKGVVIDRG